MTANVVLMCYFLSELKIVATDTIIATGLGLGEVGDLEAQMFS